MWKKLTRTYNKLLNESEHRLICSVRTGILVLGLGISLEFHVKYQLSLIHI